MSDDQAYTPRQWLAHIALADLPVPSVVTFRDLGSGLGPMISLTLDSSADAEQWTRHFGGYQESTVHDGRRWANQSVIRRHGWDVLIHGSDELALDGLDQGTTDALRAVEDGAR